MKWVSTNPSLGAGKSSLAIGAPPAHPLIAPAGGRRPEPTRTGRDWLAGVGGAHRVDRDANQHALLVPHGAAVGIPVGMLPTDAPVVVDQPGPSPPAAKRSAPSPRSASSGRRSH